MAGSGCSRSAVSLATVLAASVAASAGAQSVLKAGPEFQVNSYTIGPQQRPSVAMSAAGTALVVWESEFQDGDSLGVYGRFFDRAGAPLGPEFRANEVTAGAQTRPAVTAGADGRFTVAWAGLDGTGSGIFARQFTPAGPLGPEFQVNTYTTGDQVLPQVSAGPGGLAVVWQSNGQDGSGAGVYGRLFTATGTPRSGEFRLSESVTGDQVTPVVAALDTGSHAVGWRQQATGGASVYSRLFDSSGAPLRPEAVVAAPLCAATTSRSPARRSARTRWVGGRPSSIQGSSGSSPKTTGSWCATTTPTESRRRTTRAVEERDRAPWPAGRGCRG